MIKFSVKNFAETAKKLNKSQATVKNYANKAITASIFEVQKRTGDRGTGAYFNFKTPRSQRTGRLARSFGTNIFIKDLFGRIGPRTSYAKYVYKNNKYVDRIYKAAERDIKKHFDKALEKIKNSFL